MAGNGKHAETSVEPALRWGGHTRRQHNVSFRPDLYAWISREMVLGGLSFSEVVNRELMKQRNLRDQLAGLTSTEGEQQMPVFHVLLEQHGQKVSKTVDRVAREIGITQAMVEAFARIAMSPEQLSQWEREVSGRKRT